jgi:hypothetical protein
MIEGRRITEFRVARSVLQAFSNNTNIVIDKHITIVPAAATTEGTGKS